MAAALVVGVIFGMVVPTGTAYAPPNAAPVHLLDGTNPNFKAAVDSSGAVKVSGQVSVGGTSSVEVSNFPQTQTVTGEVSVNNYPGVATDFKALILNADAQDGSEIEEFSEPINAQFITINTDDEVRVEFWRPGPNGPVVGWEVGRNHRPQEVFSMPIAIPVAGVSISCFNEVLSCQARVSIFGL